MTRPRILLACPVSDKKAYIIFKWIDCIKKLSWKPDILLVDNSRDPLWYKSLLKSKISVSHYQPPDGAGIRSVMAACNEMIRLYALQQNYDYLFSLECDIFPPRNIIEHLLSVPGPVKSASYFIETEEKTTMLAQEVEPFTLHAMTRNLNVWDAFLSCDGQINFVYHCGLGCVLISQNVLKRIRFFVTNQDDSHADSNFYKDLFFKGIPVLKDTSIFCDHYNQDWNEIYKKESVWN
jgi:hypothetical protein